MWVDGKLTMDRQLDHITNKAKWIVSRLWHLLRKVSLSYRTRLWTILIRPLFEQAMMLYYSERSATNKEKVQIALRGTFKKFTLLKKNVSTDVINDIMNFDIDERAIHNMEITKTKWEKRVGKKLYIRSETDHQETHEKVKTPRILPKELVDILNIMTACCPSCNGEVCKPVHMLNAHQIFIPTYKQIMSEIERRTQDCINYKLSREESLEHVSSFINVYIHIISQHLGVQHI